MAQKKKLQVFVSSTYTDMHEERQAAVEAILTAGHIPAGMELFTAGDQSQMQVIERWIDESDVYLLILGGRYGTLEKQSQKSYIHLEYEYALEKQKPLFAVVIDENYLDEKVKKHGRHVIETEYTPRLREFREFVCTRMVRFWSDPRDIKLAILETLSEFSRRDDIIGWIPGNEAVNTGVVAEEIARLTKENAQLQDKVDKLSQESGIDKILYNGHNYKQMCTILKGITINCRGFYQETKSLLIDVVKIFGDEKPSLFHLFWILQKKMTYRDTYIYTNHGDDAEKLRVCRLITREGAYVMLTDDGRRFMMRLMTENKASEAEKYII